MPADRFRGSLWAARGKSDRLRNRNTGLGDIDRMSRHRAAVTVPPITALLLPADQHKRLKDAARALWLNRRRGLGRRDESPFMAEMTIQDPDMRECAILLRVRDRSLHAYIQQYPFCTGPDETLNQKCFAALREKLDSSGSRPIEPQEQCF